MSVVDLAACLDEQHQDWAFGHHLDLTPPPQLRKLSVGGWDTWTDDVEQGQDVLQNAGFLGVHCRDIGFLKCSAHTTRLVRKSELHWFSVIGMMRGA